LDPSRQSGRSAGIEVHLSRRAALILLLALLPPWLGLGAYLALAGLLWLALLGLAAAAALQLAFPLEARSGHLAAAIYGAACAAATGMAARVMMELWVPPILCPPAILSFLAFSLLSWVEVSLTLQKLARRS